MASQLGIFDNRTRLGRWRLGLLLVCLAPFAVAQERYPSLAIELIVPFGPGGGDDAMTRTIAPLLQRELATPVFVSNVAGHSGNAGLTKLLVNPPDGYTIAVLSSATIAGWVLNVGYARPDDFIMLGIAQDTPSMMFIPAVSPLRSFQELLDTVKTNPGTVRIATSGVGTTDDVVLRLLGGRGYQAVNAPFSKPLERYAAVSGQRALAIYEEPGHAEKFLTSQQWRPLVVLDEVRNPHFPNVPSISEFGVSVGNIRNFRILVVSAKTPADRVKLLVDALERSLSTPDWKKYCESTLTCAHERTPQDASLRARKFYQDIEAKFPRNTMQGAQK